MQPSSSNRCAPTRRSVIPPRGQETLDKGTGWEARVLFEETTSTLLCGDLFTRLGDGPAITGDDIVGPAMEAEALFRYSSLAPDTAEAMRKLGDLVPATLALMYGSSFRGDGKKALYDLAGAYESRYLD